MADIQPGDLVASCRFLLDYAYYGNTISRGQIPAAHRVRGTDDRVR